MKKQKRIRIALFLLLILIIVISGCSGLPKTAKINITIDPNPVPYDSEAENWPFDIILDESNGVGVTLSSIRWDEYNQEEQLFLTQFIYEADEEESLVSAIDKRYTQTKHTLFGSMFWTSISCTYL